MTINFAFFWIGQDIATPTALTDSIRVIYGDAAAVYQLTDMTTPAVPRVSKVLRADLAPELMMARLQASQLVPSGERTIILDADMLLIGPIHEDVGKLPDALILTSRESDPPVNYDFPEHYPEFVGKKYSEVMPYLFSFVGVFDGTIFKRLEARLAAAPERFRRWYGDQWCLKQEIEETALRPAMLPGKHYNMRVKTAISAGDVAFLRTLGVRILHFKGPAPKRFMLDTLTHANS